MKISKLQQSQLNKIGKKYQVELIIIFGSQISGKTHQTSDFDIGVLRKKDLTMNQYSDLLSNFCQIFKVKQDKIDISELKNASSLLLKEAANKSMILYQKSPESFINFYLQSYKRYLDEAKLYELEHNYLKKRFSSERKVYV